jgi:hypothetical protein
MPVFDFSLGTWCFSLAGSVVIIVTLTNLLTCLLSKLDFFHFRKPHLFFSKASCTNSRQAPWNAEQPARPGVEICDRLTTSGSANLYEHIH